MLSFPIAILFHLYITHIYIYTQALKMAPAYNREKQRSGGTKPLRKMGGIPDCVDRGGGTFIKGDEQ